MIVCGFYVMMPSTVILLKSLLDKGAMENGRKSDRDVVPQLLEGLTSISVFVATKITLYAETGVCVCESFVLGLYVGRSVWRGQSGGHREKSITCSPVLP